MKFRVLQVASGHINKRENEKNNTSSRSARFCSLSAQCSRHRRLRSKVFTR